MKKFLLSWSGFHDKLGADLVTLGGVMRCKICGHESEPLIAEQISRYLKSGWPKHCDQAMLWVTQKQLDEEKRDHE